MLTLMITSFYLLLLLMVSAEQEKKFKSNIKSHVLFIFSIPMKCPLRVLSINTVDGAT